MKPLLSTFFFYIVLLVLSQRSIPTITVARIYVGFFVLTFREEPGKQAYAGCQRAKQEQTPLA